MFREARYAVLTKTDLLPHLDFDAERAIAHAREINPELGVFRLSARSGDGMGAWFDFLRAAAREARG